MLNAMEVKEYEIINETKHEHDLESPLLELFIAIDIIFIIFSVIGNTLVIWAILRNKILNSPSFMFIISVAAAHLFVGVCVLPMFIVSHFPDDHMTSLVCKLMMFMTKVSTTASALSLLPMTIDSFNRYSPYTNKRIRFKDAYFQIAIVWTVSVLYAIWVPFMHDKVVEIHHTGEKYVKVQMCEIADEQHEMFKIHILIDFFFMYAMPLLLMIVLNFTIFWWIWRHVQKSADKSAQQMRMMTTCSGVILVTSFGILGVGNYGLLYRIFWGRGYFPKAFVLRDVFTLSSFSLSWINVVLLFGFNPVFRKVVFASLNSQKNKSNSNTNTSHDNVNRIGCTPTKTTDKSHGINSISLPPKKKCACAEAGDINNEGGCLCVYQLSQSIVVEDTPQPTAKT